MPSLFRYSKALSGVLVGCSCSMPSLFRYSKALSGVLVGCSCSVGLIVAVCLDVPLLSFWCITEITLYYNVLHTHFFIYPLFFSLFRSIFFIINLCITPNYTVLYSITSYIALSIPKLYISLF